MADRVWVVDAVAEGVAPDESDDVGDRVWLAVFVAVLVGVDVTDGVRDLDVVVDSDCVDEGVENGL